MNGSRREYRPAEIRPIDTAAFPKGVRAATPIVCWLFAAVVMKERVQESELLYWGLVVLPTFLWMSWRVTLSAPAVAHVLLLGQWLWGPMRTSDDRVSSGLPVISIMAIGCALLLLLRRTPRVPTWRWDRSRLASVALLAGVVVVVGVAGRGSRTIEEEYYVIDFIRVWVGVLGIGLLASRAIEETFEYVELIPFATLLLPLSLPLEVWRAFLDRLGDGNVFGAGLGWGPLNANVLGQGAALGLVCAVGFAGSERRKRRFQALVLVAALNGAVAIMSGSRQALLSSAAGLLTLGVSRKGKRGGRSIVVAAIAVGVIGVMALPATSGIFGRFNELSVRHSDWATESSVYRLDETKDLVAGLDARRTLFGEGFSVRRSHNLLLGLFVETGIVGTMAFIGIWALAVQGIWKRGSTASDEASMRVIRQVLMPALICVFIQQNISGGGQGGITSNMLLVALLGIGARVTAKLTNQGQRRPVPQSTAPLSPVRLAP